MKIIRGPSALENFAIDGAGSDIVDGALMTFGITGEDNYGCAIISGAAAADAIGVKEGIHDFSAVGDSVTGGTAWVYGAVNLLLPGAILGAEYDLTDAGAAIASMQSTTSVRIASSENSIDHFWFYVNAGTGIGQLVYVTGNDDTDYTLKGAPSTALVAADSTLTKILTLGCNLHVLSSSRAKLISTAAAGTARLNTLFAEMKYQGSADWVRLNPVNHHDLQLNGKAPVFRNGLVAVDSFFAPID